MQGEILLLMSVSPHVILTKERRQSKNRDGEYTLAHTVKAVSTKPRQNQVSPFPAYWRNSNSCHECQTWIVRKENQKRRGQSKTKKKKNGGGEQLKEKCIWQPKRTSWAVSENVRLQSANRNPRSNSPRAVLERQWSMETNGWCPVKREAQLFFFSSQPIHLRVGRSSPPFPNMSSFRPTRAGSARETILGYSGKKRRNSDPCWQCPFGAQRPDARMKSTNFTAASLCRLLH